MEPRWTSCRCAVRRARPAADGQMRRNTHIREHTEPVSTTAYSNGGSLLNLSVVSESKPVQVCKQVSIATQLLEFVQHFLFSFKIKNS